MNSLRFVMILFIAFFSFFSCQETDNNYDKEQKVAIVGAGISGITAARYLEEKGYTNVTVFEKESQPGGKIYSVEYEGLAYDLGAVFILESYKEVIKLAREYDIPMTSLYQQAMVGTDGKIYTILDYMLKDQTIPEIIDDVFQFYDFMATCPKIGRPGFSNIPDDFYMPMEDFLEKYPNEALSSFKQVIESFGLGFASETPAIYFLKCYEDVITPVNVVDIAGNVLQGIGLFRAFREGYQNFCREISSTLTIKYNSKVTQIVRNNEDGKIRLTAAGITESFDKVIIACPPDKALSFLDASEEETDLFNRIRYDNYAVTLFKTDMRLCKNRLVAFQENYGKETIGSVTGLIQPHRDANMYLAYQYVESPEDDAYLTEELNYQIDSMNGHVAEIATRKYWETYPHVTTEDFENGFYERLDAIQGKNGTYYTSLTYGVNETMELTKEIMDEFFLNQFDTNE